MKNVFAFFIGIACTISLYASRFQVDGLFYDITNENEVGVAYGAPSTVFPNTYIGDIVIPEIVTYNGTTYNVTSIEEDAFYQCPNLTSITIPACVKSIGDMAFSGCYALTSISLPTSMTSLGDGALADCSSLDSIICDAVTPPALEPETFYNITPSDITLSVPSESVNTYKTTPIWQDFNIQAKNDIVNNIENVDSDSEDCTNKTYKVFRNGQLIIIRNGLEYNAAGIKL